MADTTESKTSFHINDVEYFVEDLSDENRTKLSLINFSNQELSHYQAKVNLIMIAKDKLVLELKESLENVKEVE